MSTAQRAEPRFPSRQPIPEAATAAARIGRRRSVNLLTRLLTIALMTAILALLFVGQRDQQTRQFAVRGAQRVADELQRRLNQTRRPPELALFAPTGAASNEYQFNLAYAIRGIRGLGGAVACQREPTWLVTRADGRAVIFFDGERFSAQWLSEAEFAPLAADFGM